MQVTRIELPQMPQPVLDCLQRLRDAGGRGWVVGGAVRDLLQGGNPDDFDLASDLTPLQLEKILPQAEMREAALGTCRTTIDGHQLTVTTLRSESAYSNQRHPDEVQFVTDVAVDAQRRDFTVNALYYDPATSELLDPVNGHADLQASVLRTIGDPLGRFQEDPLRMLRLIRFAASADLQITTGAAAATRTCAGEIAVISVERIYAELTNAFTGPGRGRALGLLVEMGLADILLPEVSAMHGVEQPPLYHPEGDVLVHVKMVLDLVPAADPVLAWSAVLHDVGKPPTFRIAEDRIRFDGHDALSAKMAEEILLRFKAPKALRQRVVDICLQHIRFAALPQMRPVRAERWLRDPDFPLHLAFHHADCMASHGKLEIHEFAERALRELKPLTEPLLHGRDVLAMGIEPGRQVGQLLQAVKAQLSESQVAPTREQALVLLRDAVERLRQGPDDCAR